MSGRLYTGTSGLVLPFRNRQHYPEALLDKSRLEVYGTLNNSIEINSSFYKIPMKTTVIKWNNSVPANFRFTFKLFRALTHTKGLPYNSADLDQFMNALSGMDRYKRGCILVQFPASFKIDQRKYLVNLVRDLQTRTEQQDWKLAIEFRHTSWYREEIYAYLYSLGIIMVIHDKTGCGTPLLEHPASYVYCRFHGPDGNYKGTYDDSFLSEYATYIREWLEEGKDVYAYFNNTMGEALSNMKTLRKYLAG